MKSFHTMAKFYFHHKSLETYTIKVMVKSKSRSSAKFYFHHKSMQVKPALHVNGVILSAYFDGRVHSIWPPSTPPGTHGFFFTKCFWKIFFKPKLYKSIFEGKTSLGYLNQGWSPQGWDWGLEFMKMTQRIVQKLHHKGAACCDGRAHSLCLPSMGKEKLFKSPTSFKKCAKITQKTKHEK